MKKVLQTDLTPEGGNCFSACIASVLEIGINEVPNVAKDFAWFQIMDEFVNKYGYGLYLMERKEIPVSDIWCKHAYIIANGQSPRHENRTHSVVYKNGKMVHDPHPDNIGLDGKPKSYIFFIALNPKAKK